MRLNSFGVRGFANLSGPVELGPLRDINVIYGPSESGKSNLLRALELYFYLLASSETVNKLQVQSLETASGRFAALLETAFHRTDPVPIQFRAEWQIDSATLAASGLSREIPGDTLRTEIELRSLNRRPETSVKIWQIGDKDAAQLDRLQEPAIVGYAQQLRRVCADARPFQFDEPVYPLWRLVDSGEHFPQSLREQLFDAAQSTSSEARRRWEIFARLAQSARPSAAGQAGWRTGFDRKAGRANLLWVDGDEILSLDQLSAGVQRYTFLVAALCLQELPWILMEEPEWRLSPQLQARFVAAARQVIQSGLGPRQVFISSHSPALAAAGHPFLLEWRDGEPVAKQAAPASSVAESGTDAGAGDDLDSLIGLVDELSEIDPDALAAEPVTPARGG